jgi:hypothetical protein
MKFLVLAFTIFAALATFTDANTIKNLRGGSEILDHYALESRVTMKGVVGDPSTEDLNLLGKALVASYNDVHWELGYYFLSGYEITESFGHDSKESQLSVSIVAPFKQCDTACCLCNNDDEDDVNSNSLLTTPLLQAWEASFCEKIRSSTSMNLKTANKCSIVMEVAETTNFVMVAETIN